MKIRKEWEQENREKWKEKEQEKNGNRFAKKSKFWLMRIRKGKKIVNFYMESSSKSCCSVKSAFQAKFREIQDRSIKNSVKR